MPENTERAVKTNYPANSHKSRDKKVAPEAKEDRKVEKVVTGAVVQRKKPLGRKMAETFFADNLHNVTQFIFFDVLVPAAKNMVVDSVNQGLERMVMGESYRRGGSSGSRSSGGRHTSYQKMYSPNREDRSSNQRSMTSRGRATHDFDEIVLETRGEAENVIDTLSDLIRDYDSATVSDLYEMVGITGNFTDDKWGWVDVRSLGNVVRVSGGYLLDLSKPVALD